MAPAPRRAGVAQRDPLGDVVRLDPHPLLLDHPPADAQRHQVHPGLEPRDQPHVAVAQLTVILPVDAHPRPHPGAVADPQIPAEGIDRRPLRLAARRDPHHVAREQPTVALELHPQRARRLPREDLGLPWRELRDPVTLDPEVRRERERVVDVQRRVPRAEPDPGLLAAPDVEAPHQRRPVGVAPIGGPRLDRVAAGRQRPALDRLPRRRDAELAAVEHDPHPHAAVVDDVGLTEERLDPVDGDPVDRHRDPRPVVAAPLPVDAHEAHAVGHVAEVARLAGAEAGDPFAVDRDGHGLPSLVLDAEGAVEAVAGLSHADGEERGEGGDRERRLVQADHDGSLRFGCQGMASVAFTE
ncbi:MAG: hypothetical protein H6705_13850 [Myxococcales bacterium]|nr:hypothetical protein [Myxococcales bacterium]